MQFQKIASLNHPELTLPVQLHAIKGELWVLDGLSSSIFVFNDQTFKLKRKIETGKIFAQNSILDRKLKLESFTLTDNQLVLLDTRSKKIYQFDQNLKFIAENPLPSKSNRYHVSAKNGYIFISSPSEKTIYRKALKEKSWQIFTQFEKDIACLVFPITNEKIVFHNCESSKTLIFDKKIEKLIPLTKFGLREGEVIYPKGLTTGSNGVVFISDSLTGSIQGFQQETGKYIGTLGLKDKLTLFSHPINIQYFSNGRIGIVDLGSSMVDIYKDLGELSRPRMGKRERHSRLQRSDSLSPNKMCIHCHDGSKVNSIEFFFAENQHPFDEFIYKLGDHSEEELALIDNKMHCGTCHKPHDKEGVHGKSMRLQKAKVLDLCQACHLQHLEESSHPVNVNLKNLTHPPKDSFSHPFADSKKVTCFSCHSMHSGKTKNLLSSETTDHRLCLACHQEKSQKLSNHTLSGKDFDKKNNCFSCHKIHLAETNTWLLKGKSSDVGQCLNCHQGKKSIQGSKHDEIIDIQYLKEALFEKDIRFSNSCQLCHGMHDEKLETSLLKDRSGFQLGPNRDPYSNMCLGCHNKEIDKKIKHYTHTTPLIFKKLPKIDLELNVYNKLGKKMTDEETGFIGCTTCHDPHKGKEEGAKISSYMKNYEKVIPFCGLCHGDEGIVRYKFFHSERFRD